MNSFAEQLRYSANNKFLAGKTLSRCVSIAQAIGTAADAGKKFSMTQRASHLFIGSVQVGEYILTGQIPPRDLVESVIDVHPQEVLH